MQTPSLTNNIQPPEAKPVGLRRRPFLVAFVVALVGFELLAQLLASQMPEPLIWPRYEVQRKHDRIQSLAELDCLGLVVLGTSVAGAAVDAGQLQAEIGTDATVYNASLGGAEISGVSAWAREVVSPLGCPSHAIIGLSVRDLNDSNDSSGFVGRYERALGRAELLDQATTVERLELWALDNIGLVGVRQNLRNPGSTVSWLVGRRGPWREINDEFGTLTRFVNRPYNATAERRNFDRGVVFADYEAGGRHSAEVREMIEALQADGTTVTVVMLPYTEVETQELLPAGADDIAAYVSAVQQLQGSTGAGLIDLRDVVSTREFFADDYHVNGAGAELITAELARRISIDD